MCIVPDMDLSPLSILRLAAPGAPKLREIAAEIGCSHSAVHHFESGRNLLAADRLKAYAKAVGAKPSDVRRRFLLAALSFHESKARELRAELKSRGILTASGRKLAHSG